MVEAHISYEGVFRCTAMHGPSGDFIQTDAPKDNLGKGEAFSPTDLFATSLGVCGITTIAIKMKDIDLNIDGTRVRVEKHMSTGQPRKVSKIVVEYNFPPGVPANHRKTIKKIAETCPVALSMNSEIEKVYIYNFPD